jgi:hypothetical protein
MPELLITGTGIRERLTSKQLNRLSMAEDTSVKDADLASGAWNAERGEFIAPFSHTSDTRAASRFKSRALALATGHDDRHVEHDDNYAADFQDSKAYPWAN